MMNDRTFPIPSNTNSMKSEDYTNNFLQKDSNPATMEASGIVVPCEFSVRNFKAISDRNFGQSPCQRIF